MIVQFSGETRKQAIVNHFSLELEEEDLFFQYIADMGYTEDSEDEILENMIEMWRRKQETI